MLTKEELPNCPVATTVALIGGKWKLLILWWLLNQPQRFNELRKNIVGISAKVLANSLHALVEAGLVMRSDCSTAKTLHVVYSLSDLGESLRPIFIDMQTWGLAYQKRVQKAAVNPKNILRIQPK